jgi:hypothetical protein
MSTASREGAITILEEGHARIRRLISGLAEEDLTRPRVIGDGDWSAKDLIGHIATWEELAFRTLAEWRKGEVPWVERDDGLFSAPATGKVDAFNAKKIEETRSLRLAAVRTRAERTHRDLLAAIRAMSDEEWSAKATYPTPNGRRRKLGTLLGSITAAPQRPFGHAFAHLPDLEKFVVSVRGP